MGGAFGGTRNLLTVPAVDPPPRPDLWRLLERTPEWDVVVIGGGATGLGVAVDAAARGYHTLLLEAFDFAKGTSSRSTKLVHGGVRYLAQGDIHLVREALHERGLLARNAPHLVRVQPFIVPAFARGERLLFGAGLKLYDGLAGRLGFGPSRSLSASETREALPALKPTLDSHPLRGGTLYSDGQFDDARLAVCLMRTVFDLGGTALNRARLCEIDLEAPDGRPRAMIEDTETGNRVAVRARCLVNATGIWVDALRSMADPTVRPLVAPSQGVHLTVPLRFLGGRHALLVPKTDDKRVLFVVPWHRHAIVGTTDTPRRDAPIEPRPSEAEIDFILRNAGRYLMAAPARSDVLSAWAGLRPLVRGEPGAETAALSREHMIETHRGGMISVTGGKWTTYRRMGQEVLEAAIAGGLLPASPCRTEDLPLHGAAGAAVDSLEGPGAYGSDTAAIERLPGAANVLAPASGLTEAQVRFAARCELARGIEDVLARRNRLLFLDARAAAEAAPEVARILAEELGRDRAWSAREVEEFRALARGWTLG